MDYLYCQYVRPAANYFLLIRYSIKKFVVIESQEAYFSGGKSVFSYLSTDVLKTLFAGIGTAIAFSIYSECRTEI